MATQFPSDTSQSPWAGPNGVTYEWNAKGYWEASGDNLSETYLSKTDDDTAAGEITFAAGLEATGGEILSTSDEERPFKCTATGTKTGHFGFWSEAIGGTVNDGPVAGFYASNTLNSAKGTNTSIWGFNGNLSHDDDIAVYNFYAGGTAGNFFQGLTRIKGGSTMDQGWVEVSNDNNSPTLEIRRQGSKQSSISALTITATANSPQSVYTISYSGVPAAAFSLNNVGAAAIADASTTIKAFTPTAAGFSGQDFVDHLPDAVDLSTLTADSVMVSESKLLPVLVKALQEALARIETLEADVATLQGN